MNDESISFSILSCSSFIAHHSLFIIQRMAYLFILLALLFSAFFSGSEIAFIAANRLKIELKMQPLRRSGRILTSFYEQPSRFLGTMLVGNNIALVVFGILTEELWKVPLQNIMPEWLSGDFPVLLILTLITTIIVLFVGEFIPKTLFQLFAERILVGTSYLLGAIYWLLFPIAWVMVRLSELLLEKVLKIKIEEDEYTFSRVDLEHFMLELSDKTEDEEVTDFDTELFHQALQLRTIQVKNCLIKMKHVEWIDANASIETLKSVLIESKFSKIPVLDTASQTFKGYIHHQSIFKYPQSLSEITIKLFEVHLNDDGYKVLNEFIQEKKSIASVLNDDGKVVGIITLEDVLERIFGAIEDEHDE